MQEKWMYCAVDSEGNTIDFYMIKNRKGQSPKSFFKKRVGLTLKINPFQILNRTLTDIKVMHMIKKTDSSRGNSVQN
ncbi:DDE-type integrase/transposase/recombinase [Bacillus cereus]|uniref:DDE-type integrase/transposase/recombinase n=1 Tax=Bacillus cereus TaxID=1396 RepID=UPI003AF0C589